MESISLCVHEELVLIFYGSLDVVPISIRIILYGLVNVMKSSEPERIIFSGGEVVADKFLPAGSEYVNDAF